MKKKQLPLGLKIIRRSIISLFEIIILPLYYFIGILPRDKTLWIFCSWFGQRYSDNSRMLFEYVNEHHPEIKTVWLSKNREVISILKKKGLNAAPSYSLKAFAYSLRAGKIFSTTGGEISLFFCNGAEYYALWHGMPLKKILNDDTHSGGISTQSPLRKKSTDLLNSSFPWRIFTNQKKLYTVTNSEFFVPFLRTAFNIPDGKILQTGSPRCDALFYNRREPLIDLLREQFPDSRIILYMPTFRTAEWTGEVFNPFSEKYGFNFDKFLAELECQKSVFVYKPHFSDAQFMQSTRRRDVKSRLITVCDDDYDELYNFVGQVDILMTDYSSIYFDFIATKKPVILLPFDYEDYIKYSRAHYFNYFEYMEGVKAKNWQEFYKIIEKKLYAPVSKEAQLKFAEYLDGDCCRKIFEEAVGK